MVVASSSPNAPKYAWVTYADAPSYWNGAIVLALTLDLVASKYPLIVFVPEDFEVGEEENRLPCNMHIRRCASIIHEGSRSTRSEYRSCLNKLHAWTLLEFQKICWLDCDMLIVHNIDDVFDRELQDDEILAAPGCTCNIFNNPKLPTLPVSCPLRAKDNVYVNTGIFVAKPSMKVFHDLRQCDYNHPLPDQDAFNIYFRDRIRLLDPSYNYMVHLSLAHPDLHLDRFRVVHFTYDKPWHVGGNPMVPFSKDWQLVWQRIIAEQTKNRIVTNTWADTRNQSTKTSL